jgi:glycerophosphoryl diester phosphodiesterase
MVESMKGKDVLSLFKKLYSLLIVSLLAASTAAFAADTFSDEHSKTVKKPVLVAHGGGGFNGMPITNSLEALNKSYANGFRFIEVDVNYTADKIPVLFHDWNDTAVAMFPDLKSKIASGAVSKTSIHYMDYDYFKSSPKTEGLSMISFEELAQWMRKHSDVYIILDKATPKYVIEIGEKYSDVKSRLIPQAFNFQGYDALRNAGFDNVILTLYLTSYSESDVVSFASNNPLFGICIDYSRLTKMSPSCVKVLREKTYIFTHTINSFSDYQKSKKIGAQGVFTDFLIPIDFI